MCRLGIFFGGLRIPMRGYEIDDTLEQPSVTVVTNPHEGL